MEKRTLTVESQYCKNWTAEDAVRELIQNAIDTGTKIQISQMGNKWEIKDFGAGIQLSDFLIGRSSKREDKEVIGQFGEGAPIGCLVLARMGRDIRVYSRGKRFAFSFEYDNQWGCQLLTITIDDMATDKGTTALVECSQEEMGKVQAKFLKLNPQPVLAKTNDTEFLLDTGSIYVNGLKVSTISSLFGYNFKGHKELVNRDRNAIGHSEIASAIGRALGETSSIEVMRQMLIAGTNSSGAVEVNCDFTVSNKPRWKAAIKELFGSKVCLARGAQSDIIAAEDNWFVLNLPWGLRQALWYSDVLEYSETAITNGRKKEYIPLKSLSAEAVETYKEGVMIAEWAAKKVGLHTYPIKIFRDLTRGTGTKSYRTTGHYENGSVEVEVSLLKDKDVTKLVGILLHEYNHGTSGFDDMTRGFENSLTDIISTLGMTCYSQADKIGRIEKCRMR